MSSTFHAIRGLRWIGSAQILSQCISWSFTAITVRLLLPHDYGVVATAGLFTVFAGQLVDGGLSAVLISRKELPQHILGAAALGIFLLATVLASVVYSLAPLGATFFRNPDLQPVVRVACLQLPLAALSVVPLALLSREMKFKLIAVSQTIANIAQGSAILAMAYGGFEYWALILGSLFGSAARVVLLWRAARRWPTLNYRIWELKELLASGAHVVGQRLLYFASNDFDTFLLGRFSSPAALGAYSLAKTLSHTVLDQLAGTINQVTLPLFAKKAGDPDGQISGLKMIASTAAAVVFPLFWFMALAAPVALPFVFGSKWNGLVVPFAAFSLILPLRTIYALLDTAVIGTGNTSTTLKNMLVWAAIMMPIIFVGAYFGAIAAALAWVVGFPLVFFCGLYRISKRFGLTTWSLVGSIQIPAYCAGLSALVALVFVHFSPFLHPLSSLTLRIVVALVLYLVLMRRFGRLQYDQVVSLALRLVGR